MSKTSAKTVDAGSPDQRVIERRFDFNIGSRLASIRPERWSRSEATSSGSLAASPGSQLMQDTRRSASAAAVVWLSALSHCLFFAHHRRS
ncbi:MAG: hypothetical protein ACXW27_18085 [Allosphingosinicella sp.]